MFICRDKGVERSLNLEIAYVKTADKKVGRVKNDLLDIGEFQMIGKSCQNHDKNSSQEEEFDKQ